MGAEEAEPALLTNFSACSIPFRKSTLREYSFITSEAGLLEDGEKRKKKPVHYLSSGKGSGQALEPWDAPRELLQLNLKPTHLAWAFRA